MLGPLILIVLGVLFLLSNIFPAMFSFGRLWPVILIVIGVVKIVETIQKRPSGPSGPSGPTGKDTP
jgi:membrane-bound ClpP family serine protease